MPVWQSEGVAYQDDSGTSSGTRTIVRERPQAYDDVLVARRGAATFGGGDPSIADVIRAFIRRYGWRAYALPILLAVTVVALATARYNGPDTHRAATPAAARSGPSSVRVATSTTPTTTTTSPPVAAGNIPLKSDQPGGNSLDQVVSGAKLPAGAAYTGAGKGTFRVLKGTSSAVGAGKLYRYDVEVENGITGVDLKRFASTVQAVLSDQRSWSGHGVALQRVDSGAVNFHVSLTSAMTARLYCGYTIPVETSCYAASGSVAAATVNRVVLNDARWVRGSAAYLGDVTVYRIYMINHEDGHALGHEHAHQCLPGGLAPVMMQQTFGLKSAATGKLCGANPWPYPSGAKGAPGAEQPDTAQNDEYHLQD